MTRFSLDDHSFRDPLTYTYSDDDDSSANTFSCSSSDNEHDEYEEPHPLGFGSTRYGFYDKTQTYPSSTDQQDETSTLQMDNMSLVQFFQEPLVISRAISDNPTETGILLKHHQRRTRYQDNNTDDLVHRMDRIAALVKAASIIPGPVINHNLAIKTSKFQSLLQAAHNQRQIEQNAKEEMAVYSKKLLEKQKEDAEILLSLIKREEAQADMILHREQMEEEKVMEQERLEIERIEERKKLKDEDSARVEKARAEQVEKSERDKLQLADQQQKVLEAKEAKKAVRAAQEATKTEYIAKAKKIVGKLEQCRASLEVFETSKEKAISRRRLQMKKIARGKMNTLSHEKEKVEIVTGQVVQALQACTQDDLVLKQQMQSGDTSITKEMTRGTRYLMDLIASTVIVRVQAEGFNGTRGDGFPLAHMLAHTSKQVKEDFSLLIAAHIYAVCPTAIPTLPTPAEGCSELELMESLGMQKDKKGEYETFDRFLTRTEGLISIMAEIMSSLPSDHTLLGGHKAALDWLARFLDLLPPDQSPLPLLTAPVLVAFLTAAGHMLINKVPEKFSQMFEMIADISTRLDTSAIGLPSATRLKKLLSSGIHTLKTELPHGAIRDYYDSMLADSALAQPCQPFGNAQSLPKGALAAPATGFQQNNIQSSFGTPSAFGATPQPQFGLQPPTASSHPFGTSQNVGNTTNSFANAAPSSSFGVSSTTNTFGGNEKMEGAEIPTHHPFVGPGASTFGVQSNASAPSPFGSNEMSAPSNNQFGTSAPAPSTAAPSPFGTHAQSPSAFGLSSGPAQSPFTSNGPVPSPFGTNTTSASHFGVTQGAPTPSPFSGGAPSSNNPFGNVQVAPAQSPFFGGATANNTFGGNASPFGGGASNAPKQDNRPPCRFFAQGKCRNGDNCKFSHVVQGQQGSNTNPPTQSRFGVPSSNPAPNKWNNPSNDNQGGNNKQPCKFFAQGKCRFGANCKFSHDMNSASSSQGFSGVSNNTSTSFGSSQRW